METAVQKTREEVVEAFRMMWGNYPAPVMLITYKHEIVAVNELCASYGTPLGVKCSSLGEAGSHSHCVAAEARRSGKPVRKVCYVPSMDMVYDGFWIPVEGEYMVHFGNDISEHVDVERHKNLR